MLRQLQQFIRCGVMLDQSAYREKVKRNAGLLFGLTMWLAYVSPAQAGGMIVPLQNGAAGVPLDNVITVSAANADYTDPIEALNAIGDASASNPYVVAIGPGSYDLGDGKQLVMKEYVNITGAGRGLTTIKANIGGGLNTTCGAILGADNAELSDLTVINDYDGVSQYACAIANINAEPRITRVDAYSMASTEPHGIVNYNVIDDADAVLTHIRVFVEGGTGGVGIRMNECSPELHHVYVNTSATNNGHAIAGYGSSATLDHVEARAYGGSNGDIAAIMFGGSAFQSFPRLTNVSAIAESSGDDGSEDAFGIRLDGDASPIMYGVSAEASGAAGKNVGMYVSNAGVEGIVEHSALSSPGTTGTRYGLEMFDGSGMKIMHTRIDDTVADTGPSSGTTECYETYDSSFSSVSC